MSRCRANHTRPSSGRGSSASRDTISAACSHVMAGPPGVGGRSSVSVRHPLSRSRARCSITHRLAEDKPSSRHTSSPALLPSRLAEGEHVPQSGRQPAQAGGHVRRGTRPGPARPSGAEPGGRPLPPLAPGGEPAGGRRVRAGRRLQVGPLADAAAEPVHALPLEDGRQPAPLGRPAGEPGPPGPGGQQGLLHQVLGGVRLPHPGQGEAVQVVAVPGHPAGRAGRVRRSGLPPRSSSAPHGWLVGGRPPA